MSEITPDVLLTRPQNRCVVCGPDNSRGLQIDFATEEDGAVSAEWVASEDFEGYAGVLHGGIICTLLDEAMAKAVIARGWRAMTVEITARYRHHVATGERLLIRGRITDRRKRRILAEALITTISGSLRAEASAIFLTV